MDTDTDYFQQHIPENHCFGCGTKNADGLQIKSYWVADGVARCDYQPEPQHSAGPPHVLNGGIIATLIDCHAINTAWAHARKHKDDDSADHAPDWFVTGSLSIRYLKPAALADTVTLTATVRSVEGRKIRVDCEMHSRDELTATAEVLAVSVPPAWLKEPAT